MANRIQKITLEKIAKEKFAKQIVKAIDSIELEVWENAESGLSLDIGKKTIRLRLSYIVSTKKFLVWSGGIATAIGGGITILKWLTPILVAYLANPPP